RSSISTDETAARRGLVREAEDDRAAPRETRDPAAILAGLGDAEERTSPDLVLPGYDALGGDAIEHAIERAEGLDDRPTLPPEAPSSDASLDALAAATLFAAADEHGELEAPGSADDRPTLPP